LAQLKANYFHQNLRKETSAVEAEKTQNTTPIVRQPDAVCDGCTAAVLITVVHDVGGHDTGYLGDKYTLIFLHITNFRNA
jgi:hypothetical protein